MYKHRQHFQRDEQHSAVVLIINNINFNGQRFRARRSMNTATAASPQRYKPFKMKLFLLPICLLMLSCNTGQNGNFEDRKVHSDTSSLFYQGTPLFVFNENIDKLIAKPSFYQDTANRQAGGYTYLTIDTFFSARQSTGALVGNLLIETDNRRQIQRVYGNWAISVQMNDKTKQEAIDTIKRKFFPNMPQNFLLTETNTVQHKNFTEEFEFYPSPDSADLDHGYIPHWSFVYEAKRTKNGL